MRIFAAFILQQQHGLLFVSAFAVFLTFMLLSAWHPCCFFSLLLLLALAVLVNSEC